MKTPTTPYEALLMASAIKILHSNPRNDEGYMNALVKGIDITTVTCSNQGLDFQPVPFEDIFKEPEMAKAQKSVPVKTAPVKAEVDPGTPAAGSTSVDEDGNTVTHNPPVLPAATLEKQAAAAAKLAEKAKKQAEAATKKAEREALKATKEVLKGAIAEQRAVAKAEREARIEALKAEGKNYTGSMLSLADRVKAGAYVKGTTGQLRSTDALAEALDVVTPTGVIQLAKHVLGLEANPYIHLNTGQQSMNLRNKMRGAITKGTLTIDAVKAAIVELDLDASPEIKAKIEAKAQAKIKREAEAAAKKAAKEKAESEKASKAAESTEK